MVNQISRYVKIQYPLKIKKEFSSNFATVKYFDKIDLFDSWLKLGAGHYSCRVGVGGGGGSGGKNEGVGVKAMSDWLLAKMGKAVK